MIIKFKDHDTWRIFGEVDHVSYRDVNGDPDKCGINSDILKYRPSDERAIVGKWVEMEFFTKNMNAPTIVIACTPIFLMNDHGRTVETI